MRGVLKYNNGWYISYLSEHEQKEFPLHPDSIITVEKGKIKRVEFQLEILDYKNGYPDYIEYEVARIIEEKSETSNEVPLAVRGGEAMSQPSGILHYLDFQYTQPQETIHENCTVMFIDSRYVHNTESFRRASLVIGKDENGNYTKILKK